MKKPRRTPNRTATRRDTPPVLRHIETVRRRALEIHVSDPVSRLRDLAQIRDAADAAIAASLDDARLAGASWQTIGGALGVSKQAAQSRHAARGLVNLA